MGLKTAFYYALCALAIAVALYCGWKKMDNDRRALEIWESIDRKMDIVVEAIK